MQAELADFCIYTMRHSDKLANDHASGGAGSLVEQKAWVEGERLFIQAGKLEQRMAIVFSAAEAASGLIYWGLVDDIENRTRRRR